MRSRLEYCAAVWDPYLIKDTKILEGIQRRAARFVMQDPASQSFQHCILITKGSELGLS